MLITLACEIGEHQQIAIQEENPDAEIDDVDTWIEVLESPWFRGWYSHAMEYPGLEMTHDVIDTMRNDYFAHQRRSNLIVLADVDTDTTRH